MIINYLQFQYGIHLHIFATSIVQAISSEPPTVMTVIISISTPHTLSKFNIAPEKLPSQ